VNGIDQDVTKTGEDRRIALCPQAVAIVERRLKVREQWVGQASSNTRVLVLYRHRRPIQHVSYCHWR
jgi:hypothetical protein